MPYLCDVQLHNKAMMILNHDKFKSCRVRPAWVRNFSFTDPAPRIFIVYVGNSGEFTGQCDYFEE